MIHGLNSTKQHILVVISGVGQHKLNTVISYTILHFLQF